MENVFAVRQFVQDVLTWIMALTPTVGAIMIAYYAIQRNMAPDEGEAQQYSRSIRKTIIGTAVGLGASGITMLIANYVR